MNVVASSIDIADSVLRYCVSNLVGIRLNP